MSVLNGKATAKVTMVPLSTTRGSILSVGREDCVWVIREVL